MAFFDKLNQVARNIGDKTSDAIETTKLNSKISTENAAAAEYLKKIGEHYYAQFAASGGAAPEVLEYCRAAKVHFDAAAEAQARIERIKAENEAEPPAPYTPAPAAPAAPYAPATALSAPGGNACPACGVANGAGVRFCQSCGTKMEAAQPQERSCPACGTLAAPGIRFCSECGQRVAE